MKSLRNILAGALLLGATSLFSPQATRADEFSLEAGVIPDSELWIAGKQNKYPAVLYQEASAEIDFFKYFFVGGKVDIYEVPQTSNLEGQFCINSRFNAGLQFENESENFRIIYSHQGQSPINPYGAIPMFNQIDGFFDSIAANLTIFLTPKKTRADKFSIEFGIIPDANLSVVNKQNKYPVVLYQEASTEIDFLKYLFVEGRVGIYEVPQTNTPAPWPFSINLRVNAGFQFGKEFENLKIIYTHQSQHPINPYGTAPLFIQTDSFFDSVGVKFTIKIPPLLKF